MDFSSKLHGVVQAGVVFQGWRQSVLKTFNKLIWNKYIYVDLYVLVKMGSPNSNNGGQNSIYCHRRASTTYEVVNKVLTHNNIACH